MELLKVLARRLQDADRMLARHAPDPLTGLPGRRAFHEVYRRLTASARRRGVPVLLLAVDVVGLKEINDRYGYGVGDEVLRTVADALLDSSRSSDLVARYGGEEFCIIAPETNAHGACQLAERLGRALSGQAFRLANHTLRLTASLGVAEAQGPGDSLDALLDRADQALLSAKRSGRNRVVVYSPADGGPSTPPVGSPSQAATAADGHAIASSPVPGGGTTVDLSVPSPVHTA